MSERIKEILSEASPEKIDLKRLKLWKEANVRKTDVQLDIRDLAENIKKIGLQNPLIVRQPETADGDYLVISGQRRLNACNLVNFSPVPCLVLKKISLAEAQIISLSENLYRAPMVEDDISMATAQLYEKYGSITRVAELLGVSEYSVRKNLRYNAVPQGVKEFVGHGITQSQAIRIYLQYPDENKQIEVAREMARIKERFEKSKFYQAIKKSRPNDTIQKIRERAKKLAEFVPYEILLPPETSEVIKDTELKTGVEAEEILSTIVEDWVDTRVEKRLPIIEL